jgi:hypothetical protein
MVPGHLVTAKPTTTAVPTAARAPTTIPITRPGDVFGLIAVGGTSTTSVLKIWAPAAGARTRESPVSTRGTSVWVASQAPRAITCFAASSRSGSVGLASLK